MKSFISNTCTTNYKWKLVPRCLLLNEHLCPINLVLSRCLSFKKASPNICPSERISWTRKGEEDIFLPVTIVTKTIRHKRTMSFINKVISLEAYPNKPQVLFSLCERTSLSSAPRYTEICLRWQGFEMTEVVLFWWKTLGIEIVPRKNSNRWSSSCYFQVHVTINYSNVCIEIFQRRRKEWETFRW